MQNQNKIVFPEPKYKAESSKLLLVNLLQNEENGLYDRDISIQRQEQRTKEEIKEFRTGIMKSILYGFKIPPVIINSKCDEQGKCVHRIIDGAHRMRAIVHYLKGEYPIDIENNDILLSINDLHPVSRNKLVNSYSIDIITYSELSPMEESEIFIKYNNVKPLHTGNRIKAEENVVVNHWREIIMQHSDKIKKLGKSISNETEDKFITTLASIYSYLYLGGDAEGGKKCLKQVTTLDEAHISEYQRLKQRFEVSILIAICKFNSEKTIKTSTHFKLLVILLFRLNAEKNELIVNQIVSSLKRKIESNTLAKDRNNGKKNNISNMIEEIREDMSQKNE
jgi:hypothetical protein